MSEKSKKILITTESHEIMTVRRDGRKLLHGFCSECAKEVEMFNLDSAVTLTGKKTADIFHSIERNEFHSIETESGHLLICTNSLFSKEIRQKQQ